jgi:hypothetical protein
MASSEHVLSFGGASQIVSTAFQIVPGGGISKHWLLGSSETTADLSETNPIPFDLYAELKSPAGSVGFSIGHLFSADIFHLLAISGSRFLGSVFHGHERSGMPLVTPCVLKCADGASAQECIVCTKNSVTVKVCC